MLLYSEDPLSKNTRITFLLPEEAMHFNLLVFPEIFHDFSSYVRLDLPILLHFPVHKHVKTQYIDNQLICIFLPAILDQFLSSFQRILRIVDYILITSPSKIISYLFFSLSKDLTQVFGMKKNVLLNSPQQLLELSLQQFFKLIFILNVITKPS